ncbi:nuclear apoptosis-inducing factor 1-like [Anguilla anguilla]|uniref:nuclear apoptosis-inducing factor 1-like n=1 Tax=Anguilla anguilla TaxID=7936 RepID=UPI0015A956D9|nr:nuclear apoptosis-inducing factor 1-like [Anguilla anguilla]XP_035271168.1 nuclear apoptosis-inducing factor 1-like [Anguilla anguilla]
MALLRHKCKKKNFTEREIEVLLGEVERRRSILFNGVSMGVSNKRKRLEWHRVCAAVNASSAVNRSAGEVKKKWFDIKVQAKKRISAHRESVGVGGWCVGAPPLSPLDERLASIIGDIHMSAMLPPLDEFTEMAESTAVKTESEDQKMGVPGAEEVPERSEEAQEGSEEVQQEEDSAPGPSSVSGAGRGHASGDDAAVRTQRDLIRSIDNVTSELKHIGNVLCQICSTLKELVKTYTVVF